MILDMLFYASFIRLAMVLTLLVSPLTLRLELDTASDESMAGWSAPAPLNFETAKPRNTAQTSGTFFSLEALSSSLPDVIDIFILSSRYFKKDHSVFFSLSQLQRWQL